MKITVNDITFQIRFQHFNRTESRCAIIRGEELLGLGHAFCSDKDQFCYATGRKLSLARAIKMAFPDDRAFRTLFWSAVFAERSKHKKSYGFIHPELLNSPLAKDATGHAYLLPVDAVEWIEEDQWKV